MVETATRFVMCLNYTRPGSECRWRSKSPTGETPAGPAVGCPEKTGCEREIRFVEKLYPESVVRDYTLRFGREVTFH